MTLLAAAGLLPSTRASAQTVINWNGGPGSWNTASDWTPAGVPNGDGDAVTIGSTSPGAVLFNVNSTIGTLTLNSGGVLQFDPYTLTLQAGTGTNGTVTVNSGGSLELLVNGAALNVSGALTNGGSLQMSSGATASLGSVVNTGTVTMGPSSSSAATTLNDSGAFSNGGTLTLTGSAAAPTALNVTGVFTNTGTANFGTTSPSSGATGGAAGSVGTLVNSGTLSVIGTSGSPATFSVTSAGFPGSNPTQAFPAVNTGTVNVDSNGELSVSGNYGNLNITNVDTAQNSGGSTLTITGVLSNPGTAIGIGPDLITPVTATAATLNLGSSSLTSPTLITAAGLNNFGTVNITGTATNQALLNLTGPASANPFVQPPGILNGGTYNLTNDAVLQYNGPGITAVGIGGAVNLNGVGASIVSTSSSYSGPNSALNTLAGNAGTLALSNGASVATASGLDLLNTGTLNVDQAGAGGSLLTVGGTLENAAGATVTIGNGSVSKAIGVAAAGLTNYGTLTLTGTAANPAVLTLTGSSSTGPFVSSSGVLGSGTYNLTNAQVVYAGPGVAAVGPGTTLNLSGAGTSTAATNLIPNAASGTNSGLNTLAQNAGTLEVANGVSVATNAGTNFTNSNVMQIDASGQGGSTVSIGGSLTNASATSTAELLIGNASLTKSTTVTANGSLLNSGLIEITGASAVQSTLAVSGAAPTTLTGSYELSGDALLEFGSGGITTIAGLPGGSGASLTLNGPNARIGFTASSASSSALAGLALNGGALTLENGATVTTNPGVNLVNSGSVGVDGTNEGGGGSTLNIGGNLQNLSSLSVGNGSISSSSTLTAAGLALNAVSGNVTVTGEAPTLGSKTAAIVLDSGITSIVGSLTLANANSYVARSGTSPLSNSGLSTLTSNAGTLTIEDGAGVTTTSAGTFNNAGNEGSITVDASSQTSGSTTLNLGALLDNAATLTVGNNGATGSSTAQVTTEDLNNTGTISLYGATANHTATLTVAGMTTSGNVAIGTGYNFATLTVAAGSFYIQEAGLNGGQTTVVGTLNAPNVIINGGVIQGTGTIIGNITNDGAVEGGGVLGGTVPGGLAVTGNYTQQAPGALFQVVNGTSNGQFSSLNVSGHVGLGGSLDLYAGDGFTFSPGQTFDIVNITSINGTISGAFSGIEYDGLVSSGSTLNIGNGLALDLAYNGNDVVLSVGSSTPSATANTWNAGTGTWNSANTSSWSSGAIPKSSSDVILGDVNSPTSGTVTLDASVSPVTVDSLTVTPGYDLSYGAANESLTTSTAVNIDSGGEIDLESSGDTLTTGGGGSNGSLTNFGTLNVENGAALKVGGGGVLTNEGVLTVQNGATVSTVGPFNNGSPSPIFGTSSATTDIESAGASTIGGNLTNNENATLDIDEGYTYGSSGGTAGGGTTLSIGGTLTNSGQMNIGSDGMSAPTTVTAAALNNTGSLQIIGSSTQIGDLTNEPTVLGITGDVAADGTFNAGIVQLTGDATLQYNGAGIAAIGADTSITLKGANASISDSSLTPLTATGTNSALNNLTTNYGSLVLADGAEVQTNPGLNLTNLGTLAVDTAGQGGSTLTVGGTLINYGSVQISSSNLPATLNAAGLLNESSAASIIMNGCATAGCTAQALLNVTGPAGSFVPASGALNAGIYELTGNAVIAYSGAGISSLGPDANVSLVFGGASIEATNLMPNNGSSDSAFNTLTANAGQLSLSNGASIVTNPGLNLTNTGTLSVNAALGYYPAVGGNLSVGGTLVNSGLVQVETGTLTAAGFSNAGGSVYIDGNGTDGPASVMNITGTAASNPFVSASGVLSPGSYQIENGGQLEYAGPGIASIGNGALLTIEGASTTLTDTSAAAGANNALDTLTSNAGQLSLAATQVSTAGNLINSGQILLNEPYASSTTLNVVGTLTNAGTYNGAACIPTNTGNCSYGIEVGPGASLNAAALVNSGTLLASAGALAPTYGAATVTMSGAVNNSGQIGIFGGAQLTAGGAFTNGGAAVLNIDSNYEGNASVSAAGFNNLGTVEITSYEPGTSYAASANLTVTGSGNAYSQSGPLAQTTVDGALTAPTVNLNGGLLQGNGTINGNVVNGAQILAAGESYSSGCNCFHIPALLTINGNYTQTSGGVLNELIQGAVTAGTDYGAIHVSGSLTLAGALDVTTLDFPLSANQSFDILNFKPNSLTGSFGTLEFNNDALSGSAASPLNIGGGLALSLVYENSTGEVLLDVVSTQGPPPTDNWIGASGTWSTAADWSDGAAPIVSQNVVVGTGTSEGGTQTVTFGEASATIGSLTVQSSSSPIGGANYVLNIASGNTLNVTNTVTNSAVLQVAASGATLNSGGTLSNAFALSVANGGTVTVGSSSAPASLVNTGQIAVDAGIYDSPDTLTTGGGSVLISGTLINNGAILIGNSGQFAGDPGITTETLVRAGSLGTLSGTTVLANTLGGEITIAGENATSGSTPAVLQLDTGISSIAQGGGLTLANANSFITTDSGNFTNDALGGLTGNAGSLTLDAGASATITGTLTSSGTIALDTSFYSIAGPLTDLATTLNVAGLNNSGSIILTGCAAAGCTQGALLNVTGPAGSFIPAGGSLTAGTYGLSGNAQIVYSGAGITSTAPGVTISLSGAAASITDTSLAPNGTSNSAFNTLTNNGGSLTVANGAAIATNAGLDLYNTGSITVGSSNGGPAGSLTVGGTLVNSSGSSVSNAGVGVAAGTLAAAGLTNTGYILSYGGTTPAAITITGAVNNSGGIETGGPMQVSGLFTNSAGAQLTLDSGTVSAAGLSSAGTVSIAPAAALTVTGSGNAYGQSGASASTLIEGTLTAAAVNVNGGLFEGNGAVVGNVTNAATVAGATSSTTPGLLTITGNYTQTSGGALSELVTGATTRGTDYGAINISGSAALAGALDVSVANGFTFSGKQSYDVLNFAPGTLSGGFDTLSYDGNSTSGEGLLEIGNNLALGLAYEGSTGQVLLDVVTPDNWTGGAGSWSTASNWSSGSPGATQIVVIGTGAGGTVSLDQNASIYDLTMQAGSSSPYTLILNPDTSLTTAGTVDLGPGTELAADEPGTSVTVGGDFTNAGTLSVSNGGAVTIGSAAEVRSLDNTGTVTVGGGVSGSVAASIAVSGTLSNAGGTIDLNGTAAPATLSAAGFASNTLTGTIDITGGGSGKAATLELQSGVTSIGANAALLLANGSSQLNLSGGFGSNSALTGLTNIAGSLQLEGGSSLSTTGGLSIASGGSLGVDDAATTVGGSSLLVNGALTNAGSFNVGSGGAAVSPSPALVSSVLTGAFTNSGATQIGGPYANGATLQVNGTATNSGTVTIASGGEINVLGSNAYAQSAGTTTVNGTLIASSVAVNGGTLRGAGYIGANVSNISATVQASADGVNPGTLSLGGSYSQGAGGTLSEIIGGTGSGQFGVLNAAESVGSVSLGGTLDLSTVSNFSFAAGESFDIISALSSSLSGEFGTLEFDCTDGGGSGCLMDTELANGTPLVIPEGTGCPSGPGCTDVGLVLNYTDGTVVLDVETPPPTAVSWTGASGAWSNKAAWSDSLVPLGYQDISIGGAGGGAGGTVTYDQASSAINSLTVSAGSSANYLVSFNPGTSLSVANDVTINSGGEIDVAAAGAALATGGGVVNGGTLNVANGGSLTVGSAASPADLTNSGTFNVDAGTVAGGSSVAVSGTLANTATVTIGNAGLTAPTRVTAGGLANSGTLSLAGGSAVNAATLTVNGNATNTLGVMIGSFANLTVAGAGNSYSQSCPGTLCFATTTVNGTLSAAAVNINNGLLQGTGTVNGTVTNGGLVAGGVAATPGVLTINGNYAQTAGGTLQESIAGAGGAGVGYSALAVTGAVSLDGTLVINTASGYTFAAGQSFDVLNFAPNELSGAFATLQYGADSAAGTGLLSLGNNLDLTVAYNDAGGDLVLNVGQLDTWNGTTDVWTGPNDATNWSTTLQPTASDDVLIGGGNGGTVTYNEASDTVASLTIQPGKSSAYTLAFGVDDGLTVTNAVSISAGSALSMQANGAQLLVGGSLTNAGTLTLGQNAAAGQGGAASEGAFLVVGSEATPANLTNTGVINVDPASTPVAGVAPPTGGSLFEVNGALINTGGTLNIGTSGMTALSVMTVGSLAATSGTMTLADTLDGTITITGQSPASGTNAAILVLGTGITSIASTGSLTLANSNSFLTVDLVAPFTNDGLSTLTSNAGALTLEGSSVSIAGNLANSGALIADQGTKLAIGSNSAVANLTNSGNISVGQGVGGATLTVSGTLDNAGGGISVGNVAMTASDTMSAQGFAYNVPGYGTITNTLNGNVAVSGSSSTTPGSPTATLLLANGIQSIAANSSLLVGNTNGFVNLVSGGGDNSALSGLASVEGTLDLENGSSVTTRGDLAVASTGKVALDDVFSTAGSKLAVGGTIVNAGELNFGYEQGPTSPTTVTAAGLTNSGTVELGGSAAGATFTVNGAASNSGTMTIVNTGLLKVTGGNAYTQSGTSGLTLIQSGGNLSAASYVQNGGLTTVGNSATTPGGTLTAANGVTLNGGTLQGTGTIAANVVNSGATLQASPDGVNPGTLTISGSYTHESGATLNEMIAGTGSGQYGTLDVSDSLTLSGTLDVTTLSSFSFANGQSFDVINFQPGDLAGTFGTLAYDGQTASGTGPLQVTIGSSAYDLALSYGPLQDPGEVLLDISKVSSADTWVGGSDVWTGSNDQNNWSQGSAPTVTYNPTSGSNVGEDVTIGAGDDGGTVTLNTNTEVKSLTVEASDNTNPTATAYTLVIPQSYTLQDDGALTINIGGTISAAGKGATLTSGNAANAGTLTLASGAAVTIGKAGGSPGSGGSNPTAAFTNYITPNQNEGNIGPTVGGTINVDTTGPGGSTLTINGTIANQYAGTGGSGSGVSGAINIGNAALTANATLVAQDFAKSGTLDGKVSITGPTGAKTPTTGQAALSLGTAVTTIASSGSLTLSGDNAFAELTSNPGSNSALTTLATNNGTLEVDNITQKSAGVTINGNPNGLFTNASGATIKATTGGTSFNSSAYNITVAASSGMSNAGTITLTGYGSLQVTQGPFVQTNGGNTTVGGTAGQLTRLQADASGSANSNVGMDIQANSNLNIQTGGAVCVGSYTCQAGSGGTDRDLSNEGTITVAANGALNVSGNLDNTGTINANGTTYTGGSDTNAGGTINVNGTWDPTAYIQSSGLTSVNGALQADSVNINAGTLAGGTQGGTGTIEGDVSLSKAILSLGGASGGSLHVEGTFAATDSTLEFLIGENGAGGLATSSLIFDPGESVTADDSQILLDFADGEDEQAFFASGTGNIDEFFTESDGSMFASNVGAGFFASDTFDYETDGSGLTQLSFDTSDGGLSPGNVPEPASWWLFIAGLGLLACAGRRMRRASHRQPAE
ncbi:MAG: PEP-CTERM sorting domain-containing protein [Steroidobacteraceae bacterium]